MPGRDKLAESDSVVCIAILKDSGIVYIHSECVVDTVDQLPPYPMVASEWGFVWTRYSGDCEYFPSRMIQILLSIEPPEEGAVVVALRFSHLDEFMATMDKLTKFHRKEPNCVQAHH